MDRLGGKIALHHGAHFFQGLLHRLAAAHQQTEPPVAGVVGHTGDDQIAHAGKAGKGLGTAAQQHAQTGHFSNAPGHQHGLGVVAKAETVADTHGHRHDVFHGAAQLGTDDIGGGVHPEVIGGQGLLHQFGSLPVGRRRQNGGGNAPADFLGVRGAGEGHHGTVLFHFPRQSIRQQAAAVLQVKALAQKHQHLAVLQHGGQPAGGFAHGKGGHGHHHDGAACRTADIIGKQDGFGHGNARKQLGIAAVFPQHGGGLGLVAPDGHLMTRLGHGFGHGKAPAAASDHGDLHRGFLLAMTVLGSVPASRRLILERWHQISQEAARAT